MADGPSLGTAYLRIAPDTSGLNAQMVGLFKSSKWSGLGKVAGAGLAAGLAASGLAKALYDIGAEFDEVEDTIRVKTGASGKHLEKLAGVASKVGKSVPVDFKMAGDAVAGLNQRLGLTGKPLLELSRQITQLSKITGTEVQTNVQSITRLFGDWSVKTKDQRDTLDQLYRTSQATGAEITTLADSMVQFGSPLRQLGLDFDTASAMFARFEKEGVNVQTLMPGLRMALKNFSQPTAELGKTFEKLGIDLRDGPSAALREVFEVLEDAPSDLKANALAFEVFGARAGPDMAAAVREGRFELDDLIKKIKEGDETIGKAEHKTRDFDERWMLFKNNLKTQVQPAAEKVFKAVGDSMKDITAIISDKNLSWGEKWDKLVDLAMHALTGLVKRAGTLGPRIAASIVRGIIESPALNHLAVGGWLLARFGGAKAIEAVGKKFGLSLGKGAVIGLALVFPMLVKDAFDIGKKLGQVLKDKGAEMGEWLVNGMIDAVNLGIRAINQTMDELNVLGKFGVDAPNIGEIGDVDFTPQIRAMKLLRERGVDPLIEAYIDAGKTAEQATNKAGRVWDRLYGDTDKSTRKINRDVRGSGKAMGEFAEDADAAGDQAGRSLKGVGSESKRMKTAVSTSVTSLATAVNQGFSNIVTNANAALKAFGVDPVAFAISKGMETENRANGGYLYSAGGMLPGYSKVDNVPAMLRSGEAVLTPETHQPIVERALRSTYGMGLKDLFRRTGAHYATGGFVDPAGPGTGVVNRAIADVVGAWSTKYNAAINYGYDPGGGHLSPGHNVTGTATDTGPAAGWGPGPTQLFEQGLRAIVGKVDQILYGSHGVGTPYPNHGWGNHAHIEWGMHPDVQGAIQAQIARQVLGGPDSPIKAMGQAALDRVRKVAQKFLGKQGGTSGADTMPQGSYKGPLDRTFPSHTLANAAGHVQLSPGQVTMLAEKAGLPGDIFEKIAHGESQYYPGVISSDGGYGLWQMTPRVQSAQTVAAWQRIGSYFNPWNNARQAKYLYDRAASQTPNTPGFPWFGTQYLAKGGFVGPASHYTPGLPTLLDQLGARKPKRRHKALGSILDLVRDIGLKPETFKRLNELTNAAGNAQEYASLAAQLNGDMPWTLGYDTTPGSSAPWQVLDGEGNILNPFGTEDEARAFLLHLQQQAMGLFQGHTEIEWLAGNGQPGALQELFDLRNVLVRAEEQVEKRQGVIADMLEKARESFRIVAAEVKDLDTRLKDNAREQEKTVKAIDNAQEKLDKEREKPKKQRNQESIRRYVRQIDEGRQHLTGLQNNHRALVAARQSALGQRDALSEKVIPAMVAKQSNLVDLRGEILGTGGESFDGLMSVQGDVPVFGVLPSLPPLGTLGGDIFEVQKSLADLGVLPTASDMTPSSDSEPADPSSDGGRGPFSISELLEFVQAIRYGVFDSSLIPAHHSGGPVRPDQTPSGTREVLRRLIPGEGVIDAGTMQRGIDFGGGEFELTITNWDEGKGYIRRVSDARIAESSREASAAFDAGAVPG